MIDTCKKMSLLQEGFLMDPLPVNIRWPEEATASKHAFASAFIGGRCRHEERYHGA
jgi:hypothetical protein